MGGVCALPEGPGNVAATDGMLLGVTHKSVKKYIKRFFDVPVLRLLQHRSK
jgi:hypothetical protein